MGPEGLKMSTTVASKQAWHIYRQDIARHYKWYLLGVGSMLLTNSSEVMVPKIMQWIIDDLTRVSIHRDTGILPQVWQGCAWLALAAFVGFWGRVSWRQTLGKSTHFANNELKRGIWDALREAPLESIRSFRFGDIMNRAIGDVNAARYIYGFTLVLSLDVVFFTTFGIVAMVLTHKLLAVACVAPFLILPPMLFRLGVREYHAHEVAQNELSGLSDLISQGLRGIRSQRAGGHFKRWVHAMSRQAASYASAKYKTQKIAINAFPLCSLPTLCSYAILFTYGIFLVRQQELTIGGFVAFTSFVQLLQGPLSELGDLTAEWQRGFASLARVHELRLLPRMLMNLDRDVEAVCSSGQSGRLEVQNLGYSFATDRVLFSELSFTAVPGQWVGVSGPVGSGKTTLLQIISGLVRKQTGSVQWESIDLLDLPRSQMSSLVSYAPERPFVFSGSIRHNLCLDLEFTEDQLWAALRVVCLDDEVAKMSAGLDSVVGEGGITLSGGQRQRLALARLVLRARDCILLDDALSALDVDTESRVIEHLRVAWRDKTVVWASHKVAVLSVCSSIVSLDQSHFTR